jgi:four helix bundle protein
MDTIAEGFVRGGNKEYIPFLSYSRSSCCASKAQFLRAYNRNHISKELFQN